MNKSLFDIANEAIKNKVTVSEPPEKEASKQNKSKKSNPHLALCHESNPSANGRTISLLTKAVGFGNNALDEPLNHDFFMKCMTNEEFLDALFDSINSDNELIQAFISKGKLFT